MAGKTVSPHLGAYPAAKFALSAYTHQLRQELAPDDILLTGGSAWLLARIGENERALQLLEKFHRLAESGYADPITNAVVYLELGDKDRALAYIEQMIEDRAGSVVFIPQGHEFDALRDDPRFHALVERAGLTEWSRLEAPL